MIVGFHFFQNWNEGRSGKKVRILLDDLINSQRVYNNEIKAFIKAQDKNSDNKLYVPKYKAYYDIPPSKFHSHDRKGVTVLRAVDDGTGELHFVTPDSSMYKEVTYHEEEAKRDKQGKIIYEEVAVLKNGKPVFEKTDEPGKIVFWDKDKSSWGYFEKKKFISVKQKKGVPVTDFDTQQLMEEREAKERVVKKKMVIAPNEQPIQSNVKTYFMNKTHEINEKYKVEEKEGFLKKHAATFIILIVIFGFSHFENKKHREWMTDSEDKYLSFMAGEFEKIQNSGVQQSKAGQILNTMDKVVGSKGNKFAQEVNISGGG